MNKNFSERIKKCFGYIIDKFNDPTSELNPYDILPSEVDKALDYYKKYPEEIPPGDQYTIKGVRGNPYTSDSGSFIDILSKLKSFPKDARIYDERSIKEQRKDRIGKYEILDRDGRSNGKLFVHENKAKAHADKLNRECGSKIFYIYKIA